MIAATLDLTLRAARAPGTLDVPKSSQKKLAAVRVAYTMSVRSEEEIAAAWALDDRNRPLYPTVPGGEGQREQSFRTGINIVMYALTGNYKADQVHIPALLERLGQ